MTAPPAPTVIVVVPLGIVAEPVSRPPAPPPVPPRKKINVTEENEEERPLKTDFLDKQAKANSAPGGRLPLMVLGGVALIGIIFGAYQLVMFIMNYDKIQAIKNVAVTLQKPEVFDGIAKVDVIIQNMNPQTISDIAFKYNILGPSGDTASSGVAHIAEMVPAGGSRHFQHVSLGPLTGNSTRMQTELVDLKLGAKPDLTADQFNKFVDTVALKDEEKMNAFTDFVRSAPNFSPGYVGLGKAYLASGEDKNADKLSISWQANRSLGRNE